MVDSCTLPAGFNDTFIDAIDLPQSGPQLKINSDSRLFHPGEIMLHSVDQSMHCKGIVLLYDLERCSILCFVDAE